MPIQVRQAGICLFSRRSWHFNSSFSCSYTDYRAQRNIRAGYGRPFLYISGLYYKLPIPVQPLKVVSAIAITFPDKISLTVIDAILILLALSGIIDVIARYFTKPVIRGIQLGLGFILIHKGTIFLLQPELFIHQSGQAILVAGVPLAMQSWERLIQVMLFSAKEPGLQECLTVLYY